MGYLPFRRIECVPVENFWDVTWDKLPSTFNFQETEVCCTTNPRVFEIRGGPITTLNHENAQKFSQVEFTLFLEPYLQKIAQSQHILALHKVSLEHRQLQT